MTRYVQSALHLQIQCIMSYTFLPCSSAGSSSRTVLFSPDSSVLQCLSVFFHICRSWYRSVSPVPLTKHSVFLSGYTLPVWSSLHSKNDCPDSTALPFPDYFLSKPHSYCHICTGLCLLFLPLLSHIVLLSVSEESLHYLYRLHCRQLKHLSENVSPEYLPFPHTKIPLWIP